MKSKDKSWGRIRPCERHKSQFIFEYHFYYISYIISEKKTEIRTVDVFKGFYVLKT